jgi:hypothetical protein
MSQSLNHRMNLLLLSVDELLLERFLSW